MESFLVSAAYAFPNNECRPEHRKVGMTAYQRLDWLHEPLHDALIPRLCVGSVLVPVFLCSRARVAFLVKQPCLSGLDAATRLNVN